MPNIVAVKPRQPFRKNHRDPYLFASPLKPHATFPPQAIISQKSQKDLRAPNATSQRNSTSSLLTSTLAGTDNAYFYQTMSKLMRMRRYWYSARFFSLVEVEEAAVSSFSMAEEVVLASYRSELMSG